MNLLLLVCRFAFSLCLFLSSLSFFFSESVVLNREELSSYECGFEHSSRARVPFSLRFFFLTLIFLLFDLEVVLMIFVPLVLYSSFHYFVFFILILFILILFLGLIFE
jgi:NADH-ubiquinone oxidoreductase chain 3